MISKPIAKILAKRPKTVLLLYTILVIVIGSQIQNVYMVSDLTSYLPEDEPIIQLWDEINEEFQIGSAIVIYVEADDIRDPLVLKEMDRIDTKINKYDLDQGEIDGVFSVRSIASLIKTENEKPEIPGGLGGTGTSRIPDDENLIARYVSRREIQEFEGVLFINNYTIAVIIIQLAEDANADEMLDKLDAIIEREVRYSDMTITGLTAVQNAIREKSMESLMIILPIAIAFICGVIFFFHRSVKGIIIILTPLAYALILTFGFFGLVQPELTLLSIAIVALLVGLGVDYSIHLLNRYSEESTLESKIEQIEKTLKLTGKAVLLSTITTMIGFGSLMISDMPPMITFGLGCAMGILFCFVSASILVPCLALALKFDKKNGAMHSWKKFANFAINNRKRVIILALFFAIMSLIVLPQIKTDVNVIDIAPEGLPELEKYYEYSDTFGGGTNPNMLLVETSNQGLTYPSVIEAIFNMEEEMRKTGATVFSIADAIKEVNDVLNRSAVVEKLSDFVGGDQLILDMIAEEGFVDENYSKTIIFVSFPIGKGVEELDILVGEIDQIAAITVIPHNGRVSQLVGSDSVNVLINKQLVDQQTRSMIIAILLVLAMLIVIFNSTLYGFLTMIPVMFVLIWEPGFLVLLDIPLSVVTISIAAIMIGIGIDYGIHLTQRIREGMATGLSKIDATKDAIEKTGLSLVEAAATTTAALSSVFFSNIPLIQQFGLIIILMTVFSLIATVLILPIFFGLKIRK